MMPRVIVSPRRHLILFVLLLQLPHLQLHSPLLVFHLPQLTKLIETLIVMKVVPRLEDLLGDLFLPLLHKIVQLSTHT